MTIDGITLGAIVRELQPLCGAKIEKIYQPTRDEVLLLLHTPQGKRRLLLSASAGDCRVHLTAKARQNPPVAPNFCMLLRKYIGGGHILAISQPGLERIVRIAIAAKDEMGVPAEYALVAEIMGKHSNIMLLSAEEKILDSLRRVSFDVSSVRQVLPGMLYVAPPSGKLNLLTVSEATAADMLRGKTPPACLVDAFSGMSFPAAGEICLRRFGEALPAALSENQAARLAAAAQSFVEEAIAQPIPCVQRNMDGLPVFYSPLPYESYAETGRAQYATVNEAVDGYYAEREAHFALSARKNALCKTIRKHTARVEKKLKIQNETLAAAEKSERLRLYGELLTANIYLVRRGMRQVEVTNYYTGEPIRIPLDEKLSPSANATRYFKKFNKLKTAATIAQRQRDEYEAELAYLQELEYSASVATALADTDEVKAELIRLGYLEARPNEKPRRADPLSTALKFRSDDGFTILAGRNSRGNDALTMRLAGPDDYWLHTRNIPGSHVVLFTGGAEPTELALFQAATIAAVYSRASSAGKADVDYAPRRNVWKANGAKPGMVLYEGHRTLTVSPDAALAKRLRVETEKEE